MNHFSIILEAANQSTGEVKPRAEVVAPKEMTSEIEADEVVVEKDEEEKTEKKSKKSKKK